MKRAISTLIVVGKILHLHENYLYNVRHTANGFIEC